MTSLMENDPLFNTLLNQGKSFLNIQNEFKYMVDPHLKLIEETTSPKLGSLIENFSGNFTDKTNKVASEVAAANNDGANTAAIAAFTNTVNNYIVLIFLALSIYLAELHQSSLDSLGILQISTCRPSVFEVPFPYTIFRYTVEENK